MKCRLAALFAGDENMKGRKDMKQSFSCQGLVFVHWDGKILPDYHCLTKVERLPVVVSADGIEKLLGVQQMKSETYFENGIWWIKYKECVLTQHL